MMRWLDDFKGEKTKRALRRLCALEGARLETVYGVAPLPVRGRFRAVSNDPQLVFCFDAPVQTLYLEADIQMKLQDECCVYYTRDEGGSAFQSFYRVQLKLAELARGKWLRFSMPVTAIRLDPMEQRGEFSLSGLRLCAAAPPQEAEVQQIRPLRNEMDARQLLEDYAAEHAKAPPRTVLVALHELTRTGAPLLCLDLIRTLRKRGWTVFCVALAGGDLHGDYWRDTDLLLIQNARDAGWFLEGAAALGVNKALCNTALTGTLVPVLKECGMRTVCLVHEMEASIRICCAEDAVREMARAADVIVFPARCVEQDFCHMAGSPQGRTEIFHQGLYQSPPVSQEKRWYQERLKERWSLAPEQKVVLCAGSITFGKGADLVPLLLERLKSVDAALAGQVVVLWLGAEERSPYAAWLNSQTKRMGLSRQFRLIGYWKGQAYMEALAGADAFLLPSREDSMPSVLLEAMACGTPCAAFRGSGGAQDLLAEGRGLLAPYLDITSLAQQLANLLADEKLHADIRARAGEYLSAQARQKSYAEKIEWLLEQG